MIFINNAKVRFIGCTVVSVLAVILTAAALVTDLIESAQLILGGCGALAVVGAVSFQWGSAATDLWLRRWFGAALALWGIGQLVSATADDFGSRLSLMGDWLQFFAVPCVIIGLLSFRWIFDKEPYGELRSFIEGAQIATVLLASLWLIFGREFFIVPGEPVGEAVMLSGGLLTAAAMIVSLAVRVHDVGLTLSAAGMLVLLLADLGAVNFHTSPIRVALVPVAVAMLTYAGHALNIRLDHRPDHAVKAEWRRTVIAAFVLTLPWVSAAVFGQQRILSTNAETLRVMVILFVLISVLFAARELLRGWQVRKVQLQLIDQSQRDQLTDLGNRQALTHDLDAASLDSEIYVLSLDIDKFKDVNTHLGHTVGDQVLVTVAGVIKTLCHKKSFGYRTGGDEFAMTVRGTQTYAAETAHKLRKRINTALTDMESVHWLDLTVSVGVAAHTVEGETLTNAAEALRVAKLKRNRVQWYSDKLETMVRSRANLERRLRFAIDEGEVGAWFQPVIDLTTQRVHGVEALARWVDSELGFVSPVDFVPIAEQTGLIGRVGSLVFDCALEVAQQHPGLNVAINVSPLQLRDPSFSASVFEHIREAEVLSSRLIIEVTEGIFMDPDDGAVTVLQRLADAGISIAIDDFGSGYSSLGYMSRLPADIIKVDRSLTANVVDPRTRSVVRSIIQMSSSLGLEVVTEGVETREIANVLRDLGAQHAQGWLWSAAVAPEELSDVVGRLDSSPGPGGSPLVPT